MPVSRHRNHPTIPPPQPANGNGRAKVAPAAEPLPLPATTHDASPPNPEVPKEEDPTTNGWARFASKVARLAPCPEPDQASSDNGQAGQDGRDFTGACPEQDGRAGQDGRGFRGACQATEPAPALAPDGSPIGFIEDYLTTYMVLPKHTATVIAAWVAAARLQEVWNKFPHLAINSPGKRCGKTTLLDLLSEIIPRPRYTTNISPAALYRVVEKERPILLMDECQSISRRGSEASEVIREILNAGIGRNAKVVRCGGVRMDEIQEFSVYGPKVFAQIGEPDAVLADRCVPVHLRRKMKGDKVQRYRSREVEEYGATIRAELDQWVLDNAAKVTDAYDSIDPFDIENDRMADLLMPLQAVLAVAAPARLKLLEEYARSLDERDRQSDRMEPDLQLLAACREMFSWDNRTGKPCLDSVFISTKKLIAWLVKREEEPWACFTRGKEITPEALAGLLRKYGISPELNTERTARGYYCGSRSRLDSRAPSHILE